MADSEATVLTKLVAIHELSFEELLSIDRSALVESLQRVHDYVRITDAEHVSRFNAAL